MPISREVEVSSYKTVHLTNKEIIEELYEKDAKEVIMGLLKKFPKLGDNILQFAERAGRLYPKGFQDELMLKYKKENKSITGF